MEVEITQDLITHIVSESQAPWPRRKEVFDGAYVVEEAIGAAIKQLVKRQSRDAVMTLVTIATDFYRPGPPSVTVKLWTAQYVQERMVDWRAARAICQLDPTAVEFMTAWEIWRGGNRDSPPGPVRFVLPDYFAWNLGLNPDEEKPEHGVDTEAAQP